MLLLSVSYFFNIELLGIILLPLLKLRVLAVPPFPAVLYILSCIVLFVLELSPDGIINPRRFCKIFKSVYNQAPNRVQSPFIYSDILYGQHWQERLYAIHCIVYRLDTMMSHEIRLNDLSPLKGWEVRELETRGSKCNGLLTEDTLIAQPALR